MKKTLLLAALFALFLLPMSYASIIITGPEQTKFNRGDKIPISGTIVEPTDVSGFLQLSAICDGKLAEQWDLTSVVLKAGEKKSFPEEIKIPEISVTSNIDGDCYIKVELFTKTRKIIDSTYSSQYLNVLPSALRGTFVVSEPAVQLGESVIMTGTVQRLDGTPFNGKAEIYFVQGSMRANINSLLVEDGKLLLKYNPQNFPMGEYKIQVTVSDADQNKQTFDAASFTLTNQLNVYVETDKYEYLPGATVEISGYVTNVHKEKCDIASTSLSFDGSELDAGTKGSAFSYSLKLHGDVKSGAHSFIVVVKDSYGNSGYALKEIAVNPVAAKLENKIPDISYKPKDTVLLVVSLYDQAGDLMDKDISITVTDAKRDVAFAGKVASGKPYRIELPAYAEPGEWKVKAEFGKLTAEGEFEVEEVLDMMAAITGDALAITNLGNVKGSEGILVRMEGEQGIFEFKADGSLKPGETEAIDLNKKVPSGAYDMVVGLPDGQKEFDVVVTEGKSIANLNIFFISMLLCAVGLLVFTAKLMHRKVKRMHYRVSDDDMAKISRSATEKYHAKIAPEQERYADLEDFKKRTFEEIRKTEQQSRQKSSLQSWRDTYYHEHPWRKPVEQKKSDDGMNNAADFFGGS